VKFAENSRVKRNIDSTPKFQKDEITNNSSWEEQRAEKQHLVKKIPQNMGPNV